MKGLGRAIFETFSRQAVVQLMSLDESPQLLGGSRLIQDVRRCMEEALSASEKIEGLLIFAASESFDALFRKRARPGNLFSGLRTCDSRTEHRSGKTG
jgi:hypothetical protein